MYETKAPNIDLADARYKTWKATKEAVEKLEFHIHRLEHQIAILEDELHEAEIDLEFQQERMLSLYRKGVANGEMSVSNLKPEVRKML